MPGLEGSTKEEEDRPIDSREQNPWIGREAHIGLGEEGALS
jgi:hypothetical protein